MIRAEDLMIWDWVHYKMDLGKDGIYEKDIQIINIYGCEVNCELRGYEIISGKRLDNLEPIPLTPEILEKNGFSGEGYNMGVIGFHTDPIPEVKDGYEVFIWKDMCLEIKHGFTHLKRYTFYVHELQHSLKLCGIEKEIEL